jgi:hypothetical protein
VVVVGLDNMKQPAAILVLQYWYTILVIPVFYQYLPVSAILVNMFKLSVLYCININNCSISIFAVA